ncbi:hypothetical protein BFN03_04270 [Rhodococcus sp. WMMA185]|nr:hypothetical protein BFN03_04270 [Rhodococcus sp. WMMA185]
MFGSAGEFGSLGGFGSLGDFGSSGSLGKPTIPGNGGFFDVGNGLDGTVKPGIYQNPGLPDEGCSWGRTGPAIAFENEFQFLNIPFQFASAAIIEPTDTTFSTFGCADWKWVAPVPHSTGSAGSAGSLGKPTIPGDGSFDPSAGDVEPGIYQNPGIIDQGCAWEREGPNFELGSEFVPNPGEQVASAVIIEPTDTDFTTADCAEWKWVAPIPGSTGSLGSS